MKKLFLIALLVGTSFTAGMAQKMTYLNISGENSETKLTIPFSEKPVITYSFEGGTSYMVVSSDNTENKKLDLSNRYNIAYTQDQPTAISEVVVSKDMMSFNGNTVIISNIAAGEQVSVYDAGGQQVVATNANSNGVAVVDMTSMPKGVIVIKAGTSTFKIGK